MVVGLVLALVSGFIAVISKMINFKLSERIGLLNGTLVNYVVASVISILVVLVIRSNNIFSLSIIKSVPTWVYLGGVFGLAALVLTIISLPKIPVTYSTILILIGQLATGFIIDIIISGNFSYVKLFGVVLVTMGICIDKIFLNYLEKKKVKVS
ncbi:DMT family transporter [Clostridium sp. OS1-26]|uniref:DMT family transporter n=1 Tax=Clostridium sp. OS1-26 TaxID=3070681 RepID=UPI0027DFAFCC|nr:DMT family transporter [Clostridium sp. OS1-26]WML34978.1 DMT family transporter [Clostridium sp. OS1-26]